MNKSPSVGRTKSKKVKVTVDVEKNEGASGEGKLIGKIGTMVMSGEGSLVVGKDRIFDLEIEELPDEITWVNGSIDWEMEVASEGRPVPLGSTRAEVFVIFDEPKYVFKRSPGVWAEALRFLCKNTRVLGKEKALKTFKIVTKFIFGGYRLTYDHTRGRQRYISSAGFELKKHMTRAMGRTVNCVDQAVATQTYSAALGIDCEIQYCRPFGFIKSKPIVGGGIVCNNPFYRGGTARKYAANTGNNDFRNRNVRAKSPVYAYRTYFGMHTYCKIVGGGVLDACAGPALGGQSTSQYLGGVIDSDTHKKRIADKKPVPEATSMTPVVTTVRSLV